jgi:hypothetical protein
MVVAGYPRTKNGPPLARYGAVAMKNALACAVTVQLRSYLTWHAAKNCASMLL